ncbi:hypothetical protein [Nannocystis punicea]|uniref:Uncharacterized protein n=1 Tax=Nannocystis punicea TaxID=2995304 RepID=A0ABY7HAU9_9BACT|nr:hypothetical protein [Nannocystis poenicansa]WAS96383.1 hypothetical protein O0S08_09505 [Nannocystis poenicansa]
MNKIIRFARTFPTLADAPLDPWAPSTFDAWAADVWEARRHYGDGLRHAAACVLAVSCTPKNVVEDLRSALRERRQFYVIEALQELTVARTTWRVGTFDAVTALATWDEAHRAAFLAWAKEPWFC